MLLVVEDINRSEQTRRLVEKLAGWSQPPTKDDSGALSSWRLLCPVWPEVFASLGDQVRKRIEPLIQAAGGFTESEGREAVLARARLDNAEKHLVWIDHWIDEILKTGVTWAEILASVRAWVDERRTIEALQVIAAAVEHRGTREDLGALKIYEGMPMTEARHLIEDTQFAVRRRSIR
ncbi:MAG: hypothetical protein C4530_22680 [Desulfobacteraceae bacterium]|nr:MAG: hypothetical protein C4530_22680 [Desulfobacteraceae bacterium]